MCRAVVLTIFIAAAIVAAKGDNDVEKCNAAFQPATLLCCTTSLIDPVISPEFKECFDKPQSPHSCDIEECVAKKIGYYVGDGTINKEALSAFFQKELDDKKLLALIEEKCVNYDISKRGPPNMCLYKKMKHCLYNQFLLYCPEWKTDGECSEVKKLVDECTMKY